jgi:beta-lactamase class A
MYFSLLVSAIFIFFNNLPAQNDSLRITIENIIKNADGEIGVALLHLESDDSLIFNDDHHYPMQSVYKFPLAMAVLSEVDKGNLSLEQNIHINKEDLLPNTWSPVRDKYPEGNIDLTVSELLSFTVSQSDNNCCDILFRLLEGTTNVNKHVHDLGVKEIMIAATEEEMHSSWDVQFTNWCRPSAMLQLLKIFWQKNALTEKSSNLLWKFMAKTSTGPMRIKGLLPEGTIVAHKTGSSGTNENGIAAATNDVGIVTLPDGNHFTIVVFVSNSSADDEAREKIIAEISRAAWDFYTTGKKKGYQGSQ